MPLRLYRIWIVEVWRGQVATLYVFDGMFPKVMAHTFLMDCQKDKDVKAEMWELTKKGDDLDD